MTWIIRLSVMMASDESGASDFFLEPSWVIKLPTHNIYIYMTYDLKKHCVGVWYLYTDILHYPPPSQNPYCPRYNRAGGTASPTQPHPLSLPFSFTRPNLTALSPTICRCNLARCGAVTCQRKRAFILSKFRGAILCPRSHVRIG